jgi:hypothetical protein
MWVPAIDQKQLLSCKSLSQSFTVPVAKKQSRYRAREILRNSGGEKKMATARVAM